MLPNFFIVGAPKAGTDELYYHLDQHPQIYMSPLKEPCFFSSEVRVGNFDETLQPRLRADAENLREYLDGEELSKRFGGIVTCLGDYERLFLRVQNETAIGEGSVCYLWSASAASAIASLVPRARIIMVLMDPAERAFRQYLKSLSDHTVTHSFRAHLEMGLRVTKQTMSIYHPFLEFGNYAEQVRRYMARFPTEQIHISLYEDRQADPAGWFKSILTFLGVDERFAPNRAEIPSTHHLERLNFVGSSIERLRLRPAFGRMIPTSFKSRIKHLAYRFEEELTLAPEDRATLVDFYRDEVLELRDILGRDLSGWLS